MILTLIILIICCIMFATPANVSLVIVGLVFWAGAGFDAKLGCLGRIIDFILLLIGGVFVVLGFCLS